MKKNVWTVRHQWSASCFLRVVESAYIKNKLFANAVKEKLRLN